jgi:hypothetical protein
MKLKSLLCVGLMSLVSLVYAGSCPVSVSVKQGVVETNVVEVNNQSHFFLNIYHGLVTALPPFSTKKVGFNPSLGLRVLLGEKAIFKEGIKGGSRIDIVDAKSRPEQVEENLLSQSAALKGIHRFPPE